MTNSRARKVAISLLAVVGGVFLFHRISSARHSEPDRDARLDEMLDQSFPASDAPAY
jgi:hypothetical protein